MIWWVVWLSLFLASWAWGQIYGFFDENINIQVLYIKCDESVLGVNVQFYQFVGKAVVAGGVVEVVQVQVVVQDGIQSSSSFMCRGISVVNYWSNGKPASRSPPPHPMSGLASTLFPA